MGLHKILKIVGFALSILAAVWLLRIIITGDGPIKADADGLQDSLVTPLIYMAYATIAIAIALVLVFVLKGLFSGNAKNTLIAIGLFVLVLAIAYFTASGEETQLKEGVLSASGSKWVSAGLNMFYILGAAALGLMVFSGVKKLINN